MKNKWLTALCVLLCVCLLSGCTQKDTAQTRATIAPPPNPYTPPQGDEGGQYTALQTLYLPAPDGTQLTAVTEEITINRRDIEMAVVLDKLLSREADENADAVPGQGEVRLSTPDGVTSSCGIVTVNLNAAALSLGETDLFTLFQCIASTLCARDDVYGVNILAAGQSPGLDTAGTLPIGCMTFSASDDPAMLHDRLSLQRRGGKTGDSPFYMNAALYFPARSGRGILSEIRTLQFDSSAPEELADTLLSALSAGADELPNVPQMPDLNGYLIEPISFSQDARSGQNVLKLVFDEELNTALLDLGLTRSVLIASVVMTLETCMPKTPLVSIKIGTEPVTALIPAGLFEGAGQTIGFPDGQMRRSDFTPFLLNNTKLYFVNKSGELASAVRALPGTWTRSPARLFEQLLTGYQSFYDEAPETLYPILPGDISSADLIGIRQEEDTLLLNFSDAFLQKCANLTESEERALIYSIVDTMTEIGAISRVRIYIMGQSVDSLSGHVLLRGEFLRFAPEALN